MATLLSSSFPPQSLEPRSAVIWFCHSPAVRSRHLSSLDLSFPLCKWGYAGRLPGSVFVLSKCEWGWSTQSPHVMVSVSWGLSLSMMSAKSPCLGQGVTGRHVALGFHLLLCGVGSGLVQFPSRFGTHKIVSFQRSSFSIWRSHFPRSAGHKVSSGAGF